MPRQTLDTKYRQLQSILKEMRHVLIAYSGGVDSTLLLKVAHDVLGDNVLAVTALSATTPRHERESADDLARSIGARHQLVETDELDLPDFTANPADKCYICKKERFSGLLQLAAENNCRFVVDGGNTDDHSDYRPGLRAVEELGVRSPLAEAGLNKTEIRELSKRLGLETWDKPSFACLASRIPYHSPITAEKLRQVDEAETYLRQTGLAPQLRVRHHGDVARLEIDPQDFGRLLEDDSRRRILKVFRKLGFRHVALDLEGYRMGSLNRALNLNNKG